MLTRIQRLQQDRHFRDSQQVYVIEGIRNYLRAVSFGHSIETVVWCRPLLKSSLVRASVREFSSTGGGEIRVSAEEFRTVSQTRRASGIMAVVRQQRPKIAGLCPASTVIAISRVNTPGNLGCLVRTAAAVQADGFILIGHSIDPFAPAVIRSAMGAFFSQKFYRAAWPDFDAWKQRRNVIEIGACPNGESSCDGIGQHSAAVLMLGEERRGLSSRQRQRCDFTVRIPMAAPCDSLNFAVAGGILLYERTRQRTELMRNKTCQSSGLSDSSSSHPG